MTLQKKDIEHLSTLARIAVSEQEAEQLANKIDAVLAYVGEINAVDTSMYEHADADGLRNVLRSDVYEDSSDDEQAALLKNAPAQTERFIRVQQMFE
jgi:aspartyl-tRNA(Asn)/glutamyl-tRNA(Gln) amidotransferase subunit C